MNIQIRVLRGTPWCEKASRYTHTTDDPPSSGGRSKVLFALGQTGKEKCKARCAASSGTTTSPAVRAIILKAAPVRNKKVYSGVLYTCLQLFLSLSLTFLLLCLPIWLSSVVKRKCEEDSWWNAKGSTFSSIRGNALAPPDDFSMKCTRETFFLAEHQQGQAQIPWPAQYFIQYPEERHSLSSNVSWWSDLKRPLVAFIAGLMVSWVWWIVEITNFSGNKKDKRSTLKVLKYAICFSTWLNL